MTIDFLPPRDLRGVRTQVTRARHDQSRCAMNNRAAESLADGRIDDAYWWARAAVEKDLRFISSLRYPGHCLPAPRKSEGGRRGARAMPSSANPRTSMSCPTWQRSSTIKGESRSRGISPASWNSWSPIPLQALQPRAGGVAQWGFQDGRETFSRRKPIARRTTMNFVSGWPSPMSGLGTPSRPRKELNVAIRTSTTRKDRAGVRRRNSNRLTDHRPQLEPIGRRCANRSSRLRSKPPPVVGTH